MCVSVCIRDRDLLLSKGKIAHEYTVSENPSYPDRRERDACVLARKTVFFKLFRHDKAEIWQHFFL